MGTVIYTKVHNHFKLNNFHYSRKGLKEVAYSYIKEGAHFEVAIGQFLLDWLDTSTTISVKTSGSTGKPKTINVSKQAMVNSALTTGDFFNLKPKDRALMCLPAETIAGRMMLVRAIILGLNLDVVPPKIQLEINPSKTYQFAAMIPMQLQENLDLLTSIQTIIVGGAPVSNTLQNSIQNITSEVFETYGMTETVSHIAVKQINNFECDDDACSFFQVLPGITISQDERGCLVIEASKLTEDKIVTNDVVKLHGELVFEWLGRIDNVINSGGVKVHPEVIETHLNKFLNSRYFVAGLSDTTLGERVVLVIEGELKELPKDVFSGLKKHEIPKDVFFVKQFSETNSGKIQRKKTLNSIK
ncbi:AMP-binding protein [Bizionia sp. KMM 8389]